PATATFTDNVTAFPAGFTVNDIEVTLNLTKSKANPPSPNPAIVTPTDNDLQVVLQTPAGLKLTLVRNQIDGYGNILWTLPNNQGFPRGISGANLGEITTGANTYQIGTVFDDNAPRSIADNSFTGPYIG